MNGEWFPSEYFSDRLPGEHACGHVRACAQQRMLAPVGAWCAGSHASGRWARLPTPWRAGCALPTPASPPTLPLAPAPCHPPTLAALRNIFENTAAVQFNHRMLAYTSLAGVLSMWRYGSQLAALPPAARLMLHALAAATAGQVRVLLACRPPRPGAPTLPC